MDVHQDLGRDSPSSQAKKPTASRCYIPTNISLRRYLCWCGVKFGNVHGLPLDGGEALQVEGYATVAGAKLPCLLHEVEL